MKLYCTVFSFSFFSILSKVDAMYEYSTTTVRIMPSACLIINCWFNWGFWWLHSGCVRHMVIKVSSYPTKVSFHPCQGFIPPLPRFHPTSTKFHPTPTKVSYHPYQGFIPPLPRFHPIPGTRFHPTPTKV